MAWLAIVLLAGLVGAPLGEARALAVDPLGASAAPGAAHPLGADHLGRDVLWRLVVGARTLVWPGLGALGVALSLGVPGGLVAGWGAGPAALVADQLIAVISAVPRFVLVLLALSVLGNEPAILAAAAGLCYAPALADELRARVAALRAQGFLTAAEAHGVPLGRLLLGHVLLGGAGDLLRAHALRLSAFVIVLETSLSYLGGFGVQQPDPSWGNLLAFDWGWPVHPVARLAPAVALWGTLVALSALAPTREAA